MLAARAFDVAATAVYASDLKLTPGPRLLMKRKDLQRRAVSRGQQPRSEKAAPPRDDLVRVAGLPAVEALFRTAPARIERLFFEDALKVELGDICLALAKAHKPYRVVRADELARIAGTSMHGGVAALAQPRPMLPFDAAEAEGGAKAGEPLLVLDGVGNPHNLGAIARTAAFFGLQRLLLSSHPEQALPSDAAYRVARGGLEHVAVHRVERLPDALRRLRQSYLVVGAALGDGKPPETWRDTPKPVALVLGNEEEGLPRATLQQCDGVVTLPGSGLVQSLNVAATAAILIHDLLAGPALRHRPH